MLELFNTLTKKKCLFGPRVDGVVEMYNCGPTVYDYAHIGNLRAYVCADILRRTLEWNGFRVMQVMNITDVGHLHGDNDGNADEGEDKMTRGLRREGKPVTLLAMRELGERYTKAFEEDIAALNITHPDALPRASDHIKEQIELIQKLEERGFTYTTSDGVYFDTSKDPHYGKLGGLSDVDTDHARVAENREKRNPRDFALWKFHNELGWESPWGKGFPGWHIECSAMSMKYLGETFDIHTGGVDHISVHHNNEIAQSENATGKQFVRYWLHNNHLLVDGKKMAKSEGTGYTLREVKEKGFRPLSLRYFFLSAHYRTPQNFTWDALRDADNALLRLEDFVRETHDANGTISETYTHIFTEKINDDLNTPEALAVVWNMQRDDTLSPADKKKTLIAMDEVIGFGLSSLSPVEVPKDIKNLLEKREEARKAKNFEEADSIRCVILERGFEILDTENGPVARPSRNPLR